MLILIVGLIIFTGIHFLPGLVQLKQTVLDRLGGSLYQLLFSFIAFSGLILIIVGKSKAEFIAVWQPPLWARNITIALMFVSFLLLVSANAPSNVKRFTRHPMLWGIVVWAIAHLISNGDLASIILFASFLAFSLMSMYLANKRGVLKEEKSYPLQNEFKILVVGFVAYAGFILLHPYLIGVAII